MGGRIKRNEKPKPTDSTAITGISGSISQFSPVGILYRELLKAFGVIHSFDIPDITEFNFQRETNPLVLEKRRTGYVTAEFHEDPAVVLIRRLTDPKEWDQANYIQVKGLDGVSIPQNVSTPSSPIVLASDRFVIQQVNEVDEERVGPRYTFGNPMVYGHGRSARVFTYGGWLIDNIKDGSAQAQWTVAYNKYLRGSKCIQNKCFAEVYYRNKIRQGYLMHTNFTEDASQPSRAQFAFTFFVIRELTVNIEQIPTYKRVKPRGPATALPKDFDLQPQGTNPNLRYTPVPRTP